MNKPLDQRISARVPIGYRVKIMADEKDIVCPSAINISMNGILVRTAERLPAGTGCYVIIFVLENGEENKILAWGVVVRDAPEGMAIRFSRILGEHGTEQLQNLVRTKCPDPAQAKQAFETFARRKDH
ncbi:MAG: PilZ domain-containing protein [Holophaga sp.]